MTSRSSPRADKAPSLTGLQLGGLAVALMLFLLPFVVEFPGLTPQGHRAFAIFLMAIALWITEAIPLHATAALIIFLEVMTLSSASLLSMPEGFTAPAYSTYFHTLAAPVLMLFLGGFFLADCSAKFNLDRNLARILLKPFGTSPKMILLGLMLTTALFSMFMSNTATTATLIAVVLPVIRQLAPEDRMRTGLALCIPVAANIGGIGTPIGTPPNAIAIGALAKAGISISFVQWMIMTIPLMLVTLAFGWFVLAWLFPSKEKKLEINIDARFNTSRSALIFYVTFGVTVLLWLTESLHGLKSSVVGFVPVVVLLSTRVFTTKDMQSLQWHVLWLVAGGIALGEAVTATQLDVWLIGLIRWEAMPIPVLIAVMTLVAMSMGNIISNSATANLLVPIGVSLAMSPNININPAVAGAFIAIGSSLGMALPVSTPPNAIAYSTGVIRSGQMAIAGLMIGAFGWAMYVFLARPMWDLLGVTPQGVTP